MNIHAHFQTPQVICRTCVHKTTAGLTPGEAAEIVHCLIYNERRAAGHVRLCPTYTQQRCPRCGSQWHTDCSDSGQYPR